MSYLKNKVIYLELCKKFLNGELGSKEFENLYFERWRKDRDIESSDEYERSQQNKEDRVFREIVSRVFTGLDCCSHDEEPDREMGEVTPDELKEEIRSHFKSLNIEVKK